MKRVSSHYLYFDTDKLLKNLVVELDDQGIITAFFDRDGQLYEPDNTLFYDGILSLSPVSLKQSQSSEKMDILKSKYQYLDFTEGFSLAFDKDSKKPLLIDFNTEDVSAINLILAKNFSLLKNISVPELICACVNRPLELLNKISQPTIGESTSFIVWDGIYLPQIQITPQIKIKRI